MWEQVTAAALVGGAISLDRTAAFQLMVSRPIVVAPLVGFLLGSGKLGLTIGALLELVWIAALPLGATLTPNETLAGAVAPAVALINRPQPEMVDGGVLALAIAFALGVSAVGPALDRVVRQVNVLLVHWADGCATRGELSRVELANLGGLAIFFSSSFVALMVFIVVGVYLVGWVGPLVERGSPRVWQFGLYLLPLIGVAATVRLMRLRHGFSVFAAGLLGVVLLWLWFLP